ncbi:PTS sugar transporter subunit IIA [Lacticaseibacillus paracasei]|uniref:PTS sugar transporter subunit IIA n=1 Tax=Lacticaseibacillus paracasei TaxID=1597 RepID=UPI001D033128|nr:hypothetical protein [Lacticaseibacillus paracasei]
MTNSSVGFPQFYQIQQILDRFLLTDAKGGTPFNEAHKYGVERPESTAVISGVNLPMLLESRP